MAWEKRSDESLYSGGVEYYYHVELDIGFYVSEWEGRTVIEQYDSEDFAINEPLDDVITALQELKQLIESEGK